MTLLLSERDYQTEGIEFLVQKKRAILGDEMGMGKSMQAIKAMARFNFSSALIVCPNSALWVWAKELEKWLPEGHRYRKFTVVKGDRFTRSMQWKEGLKDPQNRFILTTYDVLKRDLYDDDYPVPHDWDLIICDEAHKMRNRKTKAFRAVADLESKGMFLISGTPASRGPQDVWTLLHLLHPRMFRSYWRFVYAHCHVIQNDFGKEIGGVKSPATTKALMDKFMIRRFKEGRMLPKQRNLVPVEMSANQAKLYSELTEEMVTRLEEVPDEDLNLEEGLKYWGWDDDEEEGIEVRDDGEIHQHPSVIVANNPLALFIRLRQLLICPMILDPASRDYGGGLEYIVETLRDYPREDQHSVIFTPFAKALPFIKERLESEGFGPIIELRGGQQKRDPLWLKESLSTFEQYKGIALCTIKFAQSFDLDTASTGFFLGYEWDPTENYQAEDRLHRMRSPKIVQLNYLNYKGTVDDRILQVLDIKQTNVSKFIRTKQDAIALLRGELQVG